MTQHIFSTLLCSLMLLSPYFVEGHEETSSVPHPYTTYLNLLEKYPQTLGPIGDACAGEIEIILDPNKIAEIEKKTGRSVGIVAKDTYWIWINDPVKFPNGSFGMYGRVLWTHALEGVSGVAVLPLLPNGKIALNRNYRHATRSWEMELPRGGLELGETPEQGVIREVLEETGMVLGEIIPLGEMAPDSGVINTVVPLFLARVIDRSVSHPEDSEAIAAIDSFTLEEIKQGFVKGYLTFLDNGKEIRVPMRDPFLTFALFQAETRGLLK